MKIKSNFNYPSSSENEDFLATAKQPDGISD